MNILKTNAEIVKDHLASLMPIRKGLFFDFIYIRKCVREVPWIN